MNLNFISNLIFGFFHNSTNVEGFLAVFFAVLSLVFLFIIIMIIFKNFRNSQKFLTTFLILFVFGGTFWGVFMIAWKNGVQNRNLSEFFVAKSSLNSKKAGIIENKEKEEKESDSNGVDIQEENSLFKTGEAESEENLLEAESEIVFSGGTDNSEKLISVEESSEVAVAESDLIILGKHSVKNINIDGQAVNSRTIKDGSITDRDIKGKTNLHINQVITREGIEIGGLAIFKGGISIFGDSGVSGDLNLGGNILPSISSTYNLGSSDKTWANVYTDELKTVSATIDFLNGNTITSGNGTLNLDSYTLTLSGNSEINQDLTTTSTPTFATLNTGQGNYELYAMDQNVLTTSTPTFAGLTLSGNLALGTNTLTTSNTGLVSNLNADLLDGHDSSYFASLASFSGTANYIPYYATNNSLAISNIYYDGTNVGIGTTSPSVELDVEGDARVSGSLTVDGGFIMGTTNTDYLIVNGTINSHLVPASNNVYDLGSPAYFYRNVYVGTLVANNISVAGTNISGTSAETFSLNSDNTTADAEDSYLIFTRGTITPNALLWWNSASDRFEMNQDLWLQDKNPTTGSTVLTVQSGEGQGSTNLTEWRDYAGNLLGYFGSDGSLMASGGLDIETVNGVTITEGTGIINLDSYTLTLSGNSEINQNLTTISSPTFTGLTLSGFSGVLKSSAGIVAGGATTTDLPEGTNLYYLDSRTRVAISETITGINYDNVTGIFSLATDYVIPTTTEETNWNIAYSNRVDTWNYPLSFSGNMLSLLYSTNNLQLTANKLNTIQDISTTSIPTFAGLTLSGNLALGTNTLTTSNTGLVSNLNADLLDGHDSSYFASLASFSGTANYIPYYATNNSLAISNIYYDGSYVGVGTEDSISSLAVSGNLAIGTNYSSLSAPTSGMLVEGNVGIGVTSPSYKLDVAGGLNINSGVPSGIALSVNGAEAIWYDGTYFSWGQGGSANYFSDSVGIGTATPSYTLHTVGTGYFSSNLTTAGTMTIGSLSGMLKASSGTVSVATAGTDYIAGGVGTQYYVPYFSATGTLANSNIYYNGTNVGIGTTSPSSIFSIAKDGSDSYSSSITSGNKIYSPYANEISVINTASGVSNSFSGIYLAANGESGVSSARITAVNSGNYRTDLTFGVRNVNFYERMRITPDGNIGIGTTAPTGYGTGGTPIITEIYGSETYSLLNLSSSITNDGVTTGTLAFVTSGSPSADKRLAFIAAANDGSSAAATNGRLVFFTNNAGTIEERMRIDKAGNIGIGTTSPDNSKLHISGGHINLDNSYALVWGGGTARPFILGNKESNYLSFGTGSEKMRITSTGNVGIGTTAPTQQLHITGNFEMPNTTFTDQSGIIYKNGVQFMHNFNYGNNGTVTTDGHNTFLGLNAGNFTMGATATLTAHASYNTGIGVNVLRFNTTGYYNSVIGVLALYSNTTGYQNSALGVSALYYNTTGYQNSAIGINSGRYISGGGANETSNRSVYLGYGTKALADGDTNEIVIGYDATGVGSNSVVLGNDSITKTILKGNVGIGTTAPNSKLSVYSTTGSYYGMASVGDNSTAATYNLLNVKGASTALGGLSGINLEPTLSGSTGYVFSGLFVRQTVATGISAQDVIGVYIRSPINQGTISGRKYGIYQEDTSSNNYFGGKVGIGMNAPSVALDVTGDIEYTGTITDVSDQTLKKDFSEIEDALSKLMDLEPVSYKMIDDDTDRTYLGFKAQNVQEYFPEAVSEIDDDGHLGLDYTQLVAPAIAAIQSLNHTLQEQMEEIEDRLSDKVDQDDFDLALVQIETNKTNIAYLESVLGINKDNPGNIEILGKLKADEIFAKQLEVEEIRTKGIQMEDDLTSGKGKIEAGKKESVIETAEADGDYKIYITPVGQTFGKVLFVDEIEDGESFKVKIDSEQEADINFNWMIIK